MLGAIDYCTKTQTAAPANQGASQERIVKFCNCYARAIADIINGQEDEDMVAGHAPDSLRGNVKASTDLCIRQSAD